MTIRSKNTYEAIQFKKGKEKEVLEFIREHLPAAWYQDDFKSVRFACGLFDKTVRYGDYVVCDTKHINVISESEFEEYYEVIK